MQQTLLIDFYQYLLFLQNNLHQNYKRKQKEIQKT